MWDATGCGATGRDGTGRPSWIIMGLLRAPSVLISNGAWVTFNFVRLAGSLANSNACVVMGYIILEAEAPQKQMSLFTTRQSSPPKWKKKLCWLKRLHLLVFQCALQEIFLPLNITILTLLLSTNTHLHISESYAEGKLEWPDLVAEFLKSIFP